MAEPPTAHNMTSSTHEPNTATLLDCYLSMQRIRKAETQIAELHLNGEIPGFVHLSTGQESVPVGVSRHLKRADTIALTHRGHGQALAKGMALAPLFAEILGKENGLCRGHGGSMHIADISLGILGANGIVGGGLPIAAGSALAHKLDGNDNIAVAYFGDAAIAEGVFHESLNLCALWSLPCLFVCENNGWGEYSRTDLQFKSSLKELASAFGVPYNFVNGIDVAAVSDVAERLVQASRIQRRPQVLEVKVERFSGHHAGDSQQYREPAELAALALRDPIIHCHNKLVTLGVEQLILDEIDVRLDSEISAAVEVARSGVAPKFVDALEKVYAS